jgi:hypothetical protein
VRFHRRLGICVLFACLLAAASCKTLPSLPSAAFAYAPTGGASPLVVRFDASPSRSPDSELTQYLWDFGDGTQGTGLSAAHTFQTTEPRTFTVTLTVLDLNGRQASTTGQVSVTPAEEPTETDSIEFVWPFHYDADGDDAAHLNDEYVTLQNTGLTAIDMTGWRLGNDLGALYEFPQGFILLPGAQVAIHSGPGVDGANVLYWHASGPVWPNQGGTALLYDADGIVAIYEYASCSGS